MQLENRLVYRIALFATLLALLVIMLGAYTRLKDAGLGCPDWPGCYGMVVAPDTPDRVSHAKSIFPGHVIDQGKAWTEMTHRYFAGTLGVLILILAIQAIGKRKLYSKQLGFRLGNNAENPSAKSIYRQPIGLAIALVALVVFQALLGKWTVTMRLLPVVVMSHLLGGMALLSLLWLMCLRLGDFFSATPIEKRDLFKPWAALGLGIVIIQIFLGGWTSANYAALICPDFPYCQGKLWPGGMNYHSAFSLWLQTGTNFEGGTLDNITRVTIHMAHRVGALITMLYLGWLSIWILKAKKVIAMRKIAMFILTILFIQLCLGIANVVWMLPLPIAVAHNGLAAILLLSMVTLNYMLYAGEKRNECLSSQ